MYSSSSKIILPINLRGRLVYIGWCAAEAPCQMVETTVHVKSGARPRDLPEWFLKAAHPDRPDFHIVSAYASSGAAVCARLIQWETVVPFDPVAAPPSVVVDAIDPVSRLSVDCDVIVKVRASTTASREPWQHEPDPQRKEASLKFHRSTRRHDRS